MSSEDDKDTPPTSKEEAAARCVRPPLEKYDPDELPYWTITETLAWIIRRDLDAVRNERDDYRSECADWSYRWNPLAAALGRIIALDNFERALDKRMTEHTAPIEADAVIERALDPDLQKEIEKSREKIQKKWEEVKGDHSWHRESWPPSGWNTMRVPLEQKRPALTELWRAAGDGKIQAIALEYENVKAYVRDPYAGNPIDIPASHWAYLKLDPSGRPILLGPGGRVYRDVRFRRLGVKELWPKAPSLPGEPIELGAVEALPEPERVEMPEPTKQAEPKLLKPDAWLDDARRDNRQRKNELPGAYAARLHPLMQEAHEAKHVAKLWSLKTLLRRLYDK